MAPLVRLHVEAAARRFGYRSVFRDVSLTVSEGEVLCLIGPNGAGKTTLLKVLAGLLKPTKGTVTRKGRVGMVSHHPMVYGALTGRENLEFFRRLSVDVPSSRIGELLKGLSLEHYADERARNYSQGLLQRLSIARALLADPEILLLDEPTSGLDDPSTQAVLQLLADLRSRGRAVVLVTHNFDRVATVATTVGFLVKGALCTLPPDASLAPDDVVRHYRSLLADA
jgi:heme exporter protein A